MLDKVWLKATRLRLHLSVDAIANEMHVTRQTIWGIESGKSAKMSTLSHYERILLDHMKNTNIGDLSPADLAAWKVVFEAMKPPPIN